MGTTPVYCNVQPQFSWTMEFCDVIQSFGDWDEKTHGKNTYRSPFPPWKRNYSNCKNKAFISMYFPFELPEKLWSSIVFLLSKKNSGYCILGKKCKIEKKNNDSWIQNHARNWCVWKSHFLKMNGFIPYFQTTPSVQSLDYIPIVGNGHNDYTYNPINKRSW